VAVGGGVSILNFCISRSRRLNSATVLAGEYPFFAVPLFPRCPSVASVVFSGATVSKVVAGVAGCQMGDAAGTYKVYGKRF
jgi:hypothetical protein